MRAVVVAAAALCCLLPAAEAFTATPAFLPRAGHAAAVSRLPLGAARRSRPLHTRTCMEMDAVEESAVRSTEALVHAADVVIPIKPKRNSAGQEQSKIVCIGLSHHSAPVELREKVAIPEDKWKMVGKELTKLPSVSEGAVLSTCNRFEIYFVADNAFGGVREVTEFLHRRSGVPLQDLKHHLFTLTESACVWHALRVAGGLDSLVVGEGQILAQMKRCYELSTEKGGGAGKLLTRMFVTSVTAGKRVRAETGIARGGVSISSAAVELVERQCLDDIGLDMTQLDICILGAGKMGRLLVQHLTPRNVRSITVINRSVERAKELKDQFPLAPIKLAGMQDMLGKVGTCHVTFACTGASEPILTKDNLKRVIVKPTMLVDISVPRNIDDEGANDLDHCVAYNVDDLKAVVQANQARRKKLVVEAEHVLHEELETFETWQQSLGTVPMISMLQTRAERIRSQELRKAENKLGGLSVSEKEVVDRITRGIVNKLLHGPMTHLRSVDSLEERSQTVKKISAMFNLEAASIMDGEQSTQE